MRWSLRLYVISLIILCLGAVALDFVRPDLEIFASARALLIEATSP